MSLTWVSREELMGLAAAAATSASIVLDVGPGIRPQNIVKTKTHICVEPFLPYIERVRGERPDMPYLFLNSTWDKALPLFPARSVDSVISVDVIEHMTREDGFRFLAEAKRIARKQVITFTPLGFVEQKEAPDQTDRWGMKGGYWQTHRSGWQPEDFGPDANVLACRDFHTKDQHENQTEAFGAFWAFINLDAPRSVALANAKTSQRSLKSMIRDLTPPLLYRFLATLKSRD